MKPSSLGPSNTVKRPRKRELLDAMEGAGHVGQGAAAVGCRRGVHVLVGGGPLLLLG